MNNSLEGVLSEILRREANSIEEISKLSALYSTTDDKVVIEYTLADGTIKTQELPSANFLISEMNRISKNLENIVGLNFSTAYIKLSDGTIKKIVQSEIPVEPNLIKQIPTPKYFYKKYNKLVDRLVNPLLIVKFDLTNQISVVCERVLINRLVLSLDNISDIDFFNTELSGVNIQYDSLISKLSDKDITYTEYEDEIKISPKSPKYSGTYDVINIFKRDVTLSSGITVKKVFYKLNTVQYTDLTTTQTLTLKSGDKLIVNSENKDTVYVVDFVDTSTNEIQLSLSEGYRGVSIGTSTLIQHPGYIETLTVDVDVRKDEYIVYFFKPINPSFDIINKSWGLGIGVYTTNLIDATNINSPIKLDEYFNTYVKDITDGLIILVDNSKISIQNAVIPNTPNPIATDFKVVEINNHKLNSKTDDEYRKKFSEANSLKKDIATIDVAIEKQKTYISTTIFKNDKEKTLANNDLITLQNNRNTLNTKYSTIIDDLSSRTKEVSGYTPKYEIRGFWAIPDPVYSDPDNKKGIQNIDHFEYRFRYLSKSGSSAVINSLPITTDTGKQDASFSPWKTVKTKKRDKTVQIQQIPNSTDQIKTVVYVDENPNDPDQINSNQLNISITQNEKVEFQIRSVSEAGDGSVFSSWSDSIIINFPDDLVITIDDLAKSVEYDALTNRYLKELQSLGLISHISDQLNYGDIVFPHQANKIATSFKTVENKPKDVDTILIEQYNTIAELKAIISAEQPQISVALTDENGSEITKITNNSTAKVFAGYYKDLTQNLTSPKGEIITKIYYIEVSNLSATDLELLSYVSGSSDIKTPTPDTDALGYLYNQDEYKNYRKYYDVPISLRGVIEDNDLRNLHGSQANPFKQVSAFQSSQVRGSFVYCRKTDITLNNNLVIDDYDLLVIEDSTIQSPFIWNKTKTTNSVSGNGWLSDFCVHIDHPSLSSGSDFMLDFDNTFGNNNLPTKTIGGNNDIYYPEFCHSSFFNKTTSDDNGYSIGKYHQYLKNTTSADINDFPRKISFMKNDKYLVGKKTCGAYLFLAPNEYKDISTDSVIYNVGKIIKKGSNYTLRIPVIFQFRMTDYYGQGSNGQGVIGGYGSANITNISYGKKLGLDLLIKNQSLFSFDLVFEAQYKAKTASEQ